jgi:hypothetical protein
MAKSRRRSLRGRGKVADWFRQAFKDVGGFVKKHHLLSRGGNFLKGLNVLPPQYNAALGVASNLAKKAGYGRMSGRGTHLAGGSFLSRAKSVHQAVKSRKLIFRGLHMAMKSGLVPSTYAGAVSHAHGLSKSLGYGKSGGSMGSLMYRRTSGGALRLAGSRK